MSHYNRMGMVDPQGRFHSMGDGWSHPNWAQENRALVGFVGTKDEDYRSTAGEGAVFDDEGRIALDYFKDAGWIRVKPDRGVEVGGIHEGNRSLIKTILREMAKSNPGRMLYVDDGDGSKYVRVSMTGRPDFSALDSGVRLHGRYVG